MVTTLPTDAAAAALLTVTAHPLPTGALVVTACGEVDLTSSPLLRDALLAHLRPGPPHLVVDLTGVRLLDAAGLAVLLVVRKAAAAAGTRLSVVGDARPVLLPLAVTGLDDVFELHTDLAGALLAPGGQYAIPSPR
ncbi:STAS domain-containing protein [Actinokineospora pegani]|uniref:STAS domain-containing protein n=1 Tax=Actinokineospora pegani TaxID=2654637 RepID=UPI0012EAB58A|nr:STAS domain-containing protein [Actinokineospora pegani]